MFCYHFPKNRVTKEKKSYENIVTIKKLTDNQTNK